MSTTICTAADSQSLPPRAIASAGETSISAEIRSRIEAYLFAGRLRVYAEMLYVGMRREFYHCWLVFDHWIEAVDQFRTTTLLWEELRRDNRDDALNTAIATVRGRSAAAFQRLKEVRDLPDQGNEDIQYFATALAKVAAHIREAVMVLYTQQAVYREELINDPEVGTVENLEVLAAWIDNHPTPRPDASPLAAEVRKTYQPDLLLVATLRDLRESLEGRRPDWGNEKRWAIEKLAARGRTLPDYFVYCLLTRLAVQLTAQVAIFKPDELTAPSFQLLHTLHTLIGRSLRAVAEGPKHLRLAISRRLAFLNSTFPNELEWRRKLLRVVINPPSVAPDTMRCSKSALLPA